MIIASAIAFAVWYLCFRPTSASASTRVPSFSGVAAVRAGGSGKSGSWSGKKDVAAAAADAGANLILIYGTQTGTSEDFAQRLAAESRRHACVPLVLDVDSIEFESLASLGAEAVACFVVATYGEGEPTDSAVEFHEWLTEEADEDALEGLQFTVFALGNKTYEHYQFMGRSVDEHIERLGGSRVYVRGEGDEDGQMEEDFLAWQTELWPTLVEVLGVDLDMADNSLIRLYETRILPSLPQPPTPPAPGTFDARHPFPALITANVELHGQASDRSCRLVHFDLSGSGLSYETGDHLGVLPHNDPELVDAVIGRLGFDPEIVLEMPPVDAAQKPYFPGATTFRNVVTKYVDITTPPSRYVLRALAELASDDAHRAELEDMVDMRSESGKAKYKAFVVDGCATIDDVLARFDSIVFDDMGYFVELMPKLIPRYYSISSSHKQHPNSVHITAVVLQYVSASGLLRKGVATNYLASLAPGADTCDIFIRTSHFRPPPNPATPCIMVGPGTGIAPFRGFLQDRDADRAAGADLGPTVLFFGCRTPDTDYLYADELDAYQASGTLSSLHIAFSRVGPSKIYVQHKIAEHAAQPNKAKYYMEKLAKAGRYQQDVW
ncbi:NADPH cytochrome P450 reductase [Thecamonas trahens ATCC 50062]|uniref:NADPH--hemoprotein reductase n=1 Tax=Thecamonas trahens ATCC 50062 TaxID=461836 RepID=A0A0L0D7Y1_THETB|nr:NADPH cytochrome P450 reductase [Thecamonas trahens ATCC 50062]KNC48315.1 NADPH cytochrome P450 reductase [Thecamonas trahens ATCC 50062]|eukprot:XP_013758882.1 NADPH cytochrome P450 reductase [Thecamonas trahens ATCC 50062]